MRHSTWQAERLMAIRLRLTINIHSEGQDVTILAAICATVGLPAAEAVTPLNRRQWRVGNVAALKTVARRLGLLVALPDAYKSPPSAGERRTAARLAPEVVMLGVSARRYCRWFSH